MRLRPQRLLKVGKLYKCEGYAANERCTCVSSLYTDVECCNELQPDVCLSDGTMFLVAEVCKVGRKQFDLCTYRVLIEDRVGYISIFRRSHMYMLALT